MSFARYPHIKNLVDHYSKVLSQPNISKYIESGFQTASEAEELSRFVWKMLDQMSDDQNNEVVVMGRVDNSDLIPDLEYEITLFIDQAGFLDVWERISDEENPD